MDTGTYKTIDVKAVKEARLGVTTLIALVSTVAGMGISWGAYSNRLKEAEDTAARASNAVIQLQIQTATTQAQYTEILRRLDRLETTVRQQR
jgi:hypothetical protein